MSNSFEDYEQRRAAQLANPRPARPGRIDGRVRNVIRDPATGQRVGITRRDGSFIPMSAEMSRGSRPLFQQSRADKIAAARADGSFDHKRETYNRAARGTFMDADGNIGRSPAPQTTPEVSASKESVGGAGTVTGSTPPRRTVPFTVEGKPAGDWFAEKAKAQGQDNHYATADGKLRPQFAAPEPVSLADKTINAPIGQAPFPPAPPPSAIGASPAAIQPATNLSRTSIANPPLGQAQPQAVAQAKPAKTSERPRTAGVPLDNRRKRRQA